MTASPRRTAALALWISLGVCAAAAFWTSEGVAPWGADRTNVWHHYEYLAEGFLQGHTYLPIEPAPQLLRMKDPYDPAANAPYRLWDASFYKGRFYLYFGPTPVLAILPWRLLTGHPLPQCLAAAVFAVAGLAALARLLWEVRGRHFPLLTDPALAWIILVAFAVSWVPVTLRRSGVWDLPIVAAAACTWWTLYFLWRFHESGGRARWAVATGVALALLMGSRATFVPGAAALALLLLVPAGAAGEAPARRWGAALAGAAVAAAGGIALLAYNRARFGSWTEFGLSYVMFGEDYRGLRFSSPDLIPFNAWTYLFSWPQLGPYFPFLHPFWTDSRPGGFVGFEEVYGILFMMPVHLAGLVALAWALRRRAAPAARAAGIALAGAVLLSAFSALILFCWAWACSRYTTEILAGWTVASAVGLMAVFGTQGAGRPVRPIRILAALAACWSVACVGLASAEFRGFMAQTHPRTYGALAHALNYPSLWAARSLGITYGPVDLVIRVPASADGPATVLLASGRAQMANRLLVRRLDAGHVSLSLVENEHRVLETPGIGAPGGVLRVRVCAPWLYPPAAHPWWDAMSPSLRQERQTLFSLEWDSGSAYVRSARTADPVAFSPAVQGPSREDPGLPFVESMTAASPSR